MNKMTKLINLILILTLNFSCAEKKSTEKEINQPELVATSNSDTLKFTSGIRAIFQDRKGNYWFGSQNEGVSLYDGSSFKYFTTNEGLADNQIRSIQEDKNGTIWFGTANGVSSYDGKTVQKHTVIGNSESEWMKTDIDLWFDAGTRQGVYRYDGQKLNYLPFPNPKNITSGSTYAVTSISKGKNDMLWFGTYAGVFGYNGSEFTTINDETLRNSTYTQVGVQCFYESEVLNQSSVLLMKFSAKNPHLRVAAKRYNVGFGGTGGVLRRSVRQPPGSASWSTAMAAWAGRQRR
jgi:hypothetical protein